MSEVEKLLLLRETERARMAGNLVEFLIKQARKKRGYVPELYDRIEAALAIGRRAEELAAELKDRLRTPTMTGTGWPS